MPRSTPKLRELRRALGLTQAQLAANALIGLRTLQKAEAGHEVKLETLEDLAGALGVSVHNIMRMDEQDALTEGPWHVYRYIHKRIRPESTAFCQTLDDANEAISLMWSHWDDHLQRSHLQPEGRVYRTGHQALLERGIDDYRKRYLSIWKQYPNSIFFATRSGQRTGASVLLPLCDEAYKRVKTGEWSFMDVTSEHLCGESQNLLIDSGVEFTNGHRQAWYHITDSLRFAMFVHITMLSRNAGGRDLRLLSFGASNLNSKRLEANGFVQHNMEMPEFGFPIYEFASSNDDHWESQTKRLTWSHYARLLSYFLPHEAKLLAKREFMRRSLQAYQQLIRSGNPAWLRSA